MKTTNYTHETKQIQGTGFQARPAAVRRTLLFIGREGILPENLVRDSGMSLQVVDNYLQARYHLEKSLDHAAVLPYAIICELDFSRAGDYSLVELIRSNRRLRRIPFIVVASSEGDSINRLRALEMGVDDCYSAPFLWDDVFRRVEFLHRFKREIQNGNPAAYSRFDGRIPASKRVFDIMVASMALLVLSPLLLLVALIVRLESKGPILYVSKRAGSGYDIFDFYKFRSMRIGADAELKNLMHLNQYEGDGATFVKIEDDPRITRFGKFIRNTSIDELPQLLNVIKGDMSIVGNRPLPLYEAEMLTTDVNAGRFLAPAGLTGLWQITKRAGAEMSISERIALDIEYSQNYSLLYDFKIIAGTIPALFQQTSV